MGAKNVLTTLLLLLTTASALTMTVTSPTKDAFYNTNTINFTAITDPGADSVFVSVNGTAQSLASLDNLTWTYVSISIGEGYWLAEFDATAGNDSATKSLNFKVDLTAPVVSISSPLNNTYDESTELNFTVKELNLGSCWYSLDGGANNTIDSNGTILGEGGSHFVTVTCIDQAGNHHSDTESFTVHSSSAEVPTVTITYPGGGSKYQDVFELKFKTIDDQSLMMECKYRFDAGGWNQVGDVENNTLKELSVTGTSEDGSHNVTVNCSDGQQWGWKTNSFTIDNEPPSNVTISINDGDSETESLEITLTLHSTGASQCCFSNSSHTGDRTSQIMSNIVCHFTELTH